MRGVGQGVVHGDALGMHLGEHLLGAVEEAAPLAGARAIGEIITHSHRQRTHIRRQVEEAAAGAVAGVGEVVKANNRTLAAQISVAHHFEALRGLLLGGGGGRGKGMFLLLPEAKAIGQVGAQIGAIDAMGAVRERDVSPRPAVALAQVRELILTAVKELAVDAEAALTNALDAVEVVGADGGRESGTFGAVRALRGDADGEGRGVEDVKPKRLEATRGGWREAARFGNEQVGRVAQRVRAEGGVGLHRSRRRHVAVSVLDISRGVSADAPPKGGVQRRIGGRGGGEGGGGG